MARFTSTTQTNCGFGFVSLLLIGLLTFCSSFGFAKDKQKKPQAETIRGTAMGTGMQMGENHNVRLIIFSFSTDADKQTLIQAFQQGQNPALVNALNKMKAVGHMDMEGTMGYDVSFIQSIQTPTGRQIRFLTNRKIRDIEVASNSSTQSFDLTAGEIDLDAADKKKNGGFIYPASQLIIDPQGEFQFQLNQNKWNLIDVVDDAGTPGVN